MKTQRGVKVGKNYISDCGLVNSESNVKLVETLIKIQPTLDYFPYKSPSLYNDKIWKLIDPAISDNSSRGSAFEFLIAFTLLRENISPFYYQVEFNKIAWAEFDLLIFTEEIGPIVFSCKTSLRERWKQAELEAQLLKRDFPESRSFLITMDPNESSVANKIKNGPKSGLEKVMRSNQPAFDRIIQEIKSYKVTSAPVGLFTKSNLIKLS
jgi:predicted AAA+ superfamily ATPase